MKTSLAISLLPEVTEFLDRDSIPAFVGGEDYPSVSGELLETIDPGSGDKIAHIHDLSADEVNRAVEVANKAFPVWSALPKIERSGLLLKLADAVEDRKEDAVVHPRPKRRRKVIAVEREHVE